MAHLHHSQCGTPATLGGGGGSGSFAPSTMCDSCYLGWRWGEWLICIIHNVGLLLPWVEVGGVAHLHHPQCVTPATLGGGGGGAHMHHPQCVTPATLGGGGGVAHLHHSQCGTPATLGGGGGSGSFAPSTMCDSCYLGWRWGEWLICIIHNVGLLLPWVEVGGVAHLHHPQCVTPATLGGGGGGAHMHHPQCVTPATLGGGGGVAHLHHPQCGSLDFVWRGVMHNITSGGRK